MAALEPVKEDGVLGVINTKMFLMVDISMISGCPVNKV